LKPASELAALGFKMAIYPGTMVRVITKAADEYLKILKADGSTARMRERMFDFGEVNAILGLNDIMARGQRYDDKLARAAE
jgi:2-methylisocitrate lyase-like PEP mutase family enzyme